MPAKVIIDKGAFNMLNNLKLKKATYLVIFQQIQELKKQLFIKRSDFDPFNYRRLSLLPLIFESSSKSV